MGVAQGEGERVGSLRRDRQMHVVRHQAEAEYVEAVGPRVCVQHGEADEAV